MNVHDRREILSHNSMAGTTGTDATVLLGIIRQLRVADVLTCNTQQQNNVQIKMIMDHSKYTTMDAHVLQRVINTTIDESCNNDMQHSMGFFLVYTVMITYNLKLLNI